MFFKRLLTSKVSVVGIGQMGSKIAMNYKRAGMLESVYDLDPNKIPTEMMIHYKKNLEELFNSENTILLMLPNDKSVEDVCLSMIKMSKNRVKLVVDCSTISPDMSLRFYDILKQHNINFMDCPVSGGVVAASEGSLTIMAGATESEMKDIEGMFAPISKKIVACGGRSYGLIAKLCNNLILSVSMIGVSEAFLIAKKAGLNHEIFTKLVNSGSGRCWVTEKNIPVPGIVQNTPANLDYNGGFSSQLMSKDLDLAMQLIAKLGLTSTELAKTSDKIYKKVNSTGYSGKDFSIVYKYMSSLNEVEE